jgi:DNA polymerase III epsilon subunit-like protein
VKFVRDILLVHVQTTGPSTERDFPLQISAVQLDKDNLLEKKSFSSYVRHPFSQSTNDRIVQTMGIAKENLLRAPRLPEVVESFRGTFPYSLTVAAHNYESVEFLRDAFRRTSKTYEYDSHVFDLWTLGYWFLCRQGIKKIPTADTLAAYLKLPRGDEHDALATCRFFAEALRKLAVNL